MICWHLPRLDKDYLRRFMVTGKVKIIMNNILSSLTIFILARSLFVYKLTVLHVKTTGRFLQKIQDSYPCTCNYLKAVCCKDQLRPCNIGKKKFFSNFAKPR